MSTIVIKYDGVDITADVMRPTAQFTMNSSGRPGDFGFKVKDPDWTHDFSTGKKVTVEIDSQLAFTGYIMKANAEHAFPVQDTTAPARVVRIWNILGVDINILFDKRLVYNQATPESQVKIYPAGTTDVAVINDIFDNHLDISGDGLTRTSVTTAGSGNPDEEGWFWNIGDPWGLAMARVAYLPGGVFYLKPDGDLYYADDNTEDAPFPLADCPALHAGSVGYSNFAWTLDGTKLVNDAHTWGAGTGSDVPVYSNVTDVTSVTNHGLWQAGYFKQDMFKQASVTKHSTRIVNGSAQNLRGAKDDAVSVTLRVKSPGLLPGMKVRIYNDVFGFNEVLPIRKMVMTFPSSSTVFYDITAGYEPDAPWSWAEFLPWDVDLSVPKVDIPIPKWVKPKVEGLTCADLCGGITDTFTRELAQGVSDWGTSDSGCVWTTYGQFPSSGTWTKVSEAGGGEIYVPNGEYWWMQLEPNERSGGNYGLPAPTTFSFDWRVLEQPEGPYGQGEYNFSYFSFGSYGGNSGEPNFGLYYWPFVGSGTNQTRLNFAYNSTGTFSNRVYSQTYYPGPLFETTVWYSFRFEVSTSENRARVRWWVRGTSEPATWNLELDISSLPPWPEDGVEWGPQYGLDGFMFDAHADTTNYTGGAKFAVDNVDLSAIPGWTLCENHFDDFNRTVSAGWGVSTAGYSWGDFYTGFLPSGVKDGAAYAEGDASYAAVGSATITNLEPIQQPFVFIGRFKGTGTQWNMIEVAATDATYPAQWYLRVVQVIEMPTWGTTSYWEVYHVDGNGNPVVDAGGPGDSFSYITWDTNKWYTLKFDSQLGLKWWADGESEPSAWVSEAGGIPADAYDPRLTYSFGLSAWYNSQLYCDYIDFDYDGRPCYWGGTEVVVIDDFDDRTIAVHNGDSNALANTSGTNDPWTNPPDAQVGLPSNPPLLGVSSGAGIIQVPMPQTASSSTAFVTLNEGGSDYIPWLLLGNGAPDPLYPVAGSSYLDFSIDVWFSQTPTSTGPYMEILLADNVSTDLGGVLVYLYFATASGGRLGLDTFDAVSTSKTGMGWQPSTWYRIKVGLHGNTALVKTWARDSESEPTAWELSRYTSSWLNWTAGEFSIVFQTYGFAGAPAYSEFRIDNFIAYIPQPAVPTEAQGGSVAVGSKTCEAPDPTSSPTAASWATSYAFVPTSTQVWVNGSLMRRSHEYIEASDNRHINFAFPVSSTADVWVCYTVQGY